MTSVHELEDGRLLIVGKIAPWLAVGEDKVPIAPESWPVPVGADETAVIIDRALLANVLPPVAGDNAGLVEQLRYRSEECGEQEYHNLSGMPEDGSPGHHSAIWFRELRDDFEKAADTIAALEANVTLLGASLTSMQRDIDRLETDNARLREAISDTIQMIREWARENGFPVENSACFNRLSSALATAPSGQDGEGQ